MPAVAAGGGRPLACRLRLRAHTFPLLLLLGCCCCSRAERAAVQTRATMAKDTNTNQASQAEVRLPAGGPTCLPAASAPARRLPIAATATHTWGWLRSLAAVPATPSQLCGLLDSLDHAQPAAAPPLLPPLLYHMCLVLMGAAAAACSWRLHGRLPRPPWPLSRGQSGWTALAARPARDQISWCRWVSWRGALLQLLVWCGAAAVGAHRRRLVAACLA